MKKLILLFILATLFSGCETINSMAMRELNFINYASSSYLPKTKDHPADLFFEGKPERKYEVIGEIIGYADSGSYVRPILEARVRQVGGDAAIDIKTKAGTRKETEIVDVRRTTSRGHTRDVPVAKTNYYDIIDITAKVIKYQE